MHRTSTAVGVAWPRRSFPPQIHHSFSKGWIERTQASLANIGSRLPTPNAASRKAECANPSRRHFPRARVEKATCGSDVNMICIMQSIFGATIARGLPQKQDAPRPSGNVGMHPFVFSIISQFGERACLLICVRSGWAEACHLHAIRREGTPWA